MSAQKKVTINQLLDAMLDVEKPLPPTYIYRLSDLSREDLWTLKKNWPVVPAWRRQAIMEDVVEIGQDDYVLSFEELGRFGLLDTEARVRELAVRILWEYEASDLIPTYFDLLDNDPDGDVRAVAATALGQYIYLGEIEELPESTLHKVEEKLLSAATGKDIELVRRRALESLGYSSREEVTALIHRAYQSGTEDWLVTALFAMGRSANRAWVPEVLSEMESDSPNICHEAVRAAGELEIKEALPRLFKFLESDDVNIRMAAAWSLSQIGGEGVRQRLEALYDEAEDEEEADFIDSALENLDFTEDVEIFELLEMDEDEEDKDYDLFDWEEEEDED